jgi:hypothetical protein
LARKLLFAYSMAGAVLFSALNLMEKFIHAIDFPAIKNFFLATSAPIILKIYSIVGKDSITPKRQTFYMLTVWSVNGKVAVITVA